MITLSTAELRCILQNKHKFSTCLECGGKGGEMHREYLDTPEDEELYEEEDSYVEQWYKCSKCDGLGGFISFPEDCQS